MLVLVAIAACHIRSSARQSEVLIRAVDDKQIFARRFTAAVSTPSPESLMRTVARRFGACVRRLSRRIEILCAHRARGCHLSIDTYAVLSNLTKLR